jgi:hypothetical protein
MFSYLKTLTGFPMLDDVVVSEVKGPTFILDSIEGCLAVLLPKWVAENSGCLPAEETTRISKVFENLSSLATSDVIYLYSALGGMENMDGEYWTLWDLNRVEADNSEKSDFGLLFSDYLMDCWQYRIKANDNDTSAVYLDRNDNSEPLLIAKSLLEFFQRYIEDATNLLDSMGQ